MYDKNSKTREKMSAQVPVLVVDTLHAEDNIIARQSANYHPSVWGDYFISFTADVSKLQNWCEEADTLKERIRGMLKNDFHRKPFEEQLDLIDVIKRLGIAYHFEREVEEAMRQIFEKNDFEVDDNLHMAALRFRLLREHGYNVSCDVVFNKYKDYNGNFKEHLASDLLGLLSLYEAAHLGVHGEVILDEALDFTRSNLQSMVSNLEPSIARQVIHTLRHPIRKSLTKLYAWEYFSFYQDNESHTQVLLKFAKLDFNILQKQHQEELSIITKWWKDLDVPRNFPFARDRIVECYFWMLGVYYEPQYATARKFTTKVIALASTIDDIYDVYGTKSELQLFTDAVERWETTAMSELPDYMKICYQALLDVYCEMEKMEKQQSSYAICYAKEAMKVLVKAYHEESKWLNNHKVPTMEEYMTVALVSAGYQLLATTSLVGMGDIATKEIFDWLQTVPTIVQAISLIARLMDDVVSHKLEQQREHIPSAVECYMNQYGVSEEQACIELNKQVLGAWKDINQTFLKPPDGVSVPFLSCLLNLGRVIDLLYTDEDGYSKVGPTLKRYIAGLLMNPVEV